MPFNASDELKQAEAEALATAQAEAEAKSQQNPTVMQDVANSAPSYLARGVTGAADALIGATPGGMLQKGMDLLNAPAGELGHTAPIADLASSAAPDFMSTEAKTTPGKYAGAVAEGLPYAIGGPGGAARALTTNVAGSVGGEAAAQMVPADSVFAPFARFLGTVAGGGVTAGRPGQLRPGVRAANTITGAWNSMRKAVLSSEQLRQATDFAAQSLRDSGIHYDPNAYAQLGPQLLQRLQNIGAKRGVAGLDPMQSAAYQYIDEITRGAGTVPDFNDIERTVSALGDRIRKEYGPTGDRQLAKALETVQDGLDEFQSTVPFATTPNVVGKGGPVKPGAVPKTNEELNAARMAYRDLALRNIKSRRIQEAMARAEDNPNGFTAGINSEFTSLVKQAYNRRLFSDSERTMLSNVASGKSPITWLSKFGIDLGHPNALNMISSTAANAGVGGIASYFGASPAGAAAVTLPLLAGGTLAKSVAEPFLKRKNAESVAGAIRTGEADAGMAATTAQTNFSKLRWLMLGAQGSAPGADAMKTPRG